MNPIHGYPPHVHGSILPHIAHHSRASLQDVNTPDINLERDLIPIQAQLQSESSVALGIESSELAAQRRKEEGEKGRPSTESNDTRFRINIATIMISALIFLAILAWFDLIQTAFYDWLAPEMSADSVSPAIKLWYALAVTLIILILIFLIYYYFRDLL